MWTIQRPVRELAAVVIAALVVGVAPAQTFAPIVTPPPKPTGISRTTLQPQLGTLPYSGARLAQPTPALPFMTPALFNPVPIRNASGFNSAFLGRNAAVVPVNPAALNFANPLGFNPMFAANVPFAPVVAPPVLFATPGAGFGAAGTTLPSALSSGYTGTGSESSTSPGTTPSPQVVLPVRPGAVGFLPWIW